MKLILDFPYDDKKESIKGGKFSREEYLSMCFQLRYEYRNLVSFCTVALYPARLSLRLIRWSV